MPLKRSLETLSRSTYQQLALPSENNPVQYYKAVAPDLYDTILNRCVVPGTLCMKDMMKHSHDTGHAAAAVEKRPNSSPNNSNSKAHSDAQIKAHHGH